MLKQHFILILIAGMSSVALSQGEEEQPKPVPSIIINEAMSHSDAPYVDAFELHNTTDRDINLRGWKVVDKKSLENADPEEIHTFGDFKLSAKGYRTVRLGYGFVESFGLKAAGDDISLFDPSGVRVDRFKLKTTMHNRSYGYHYNSVGERDLVPLEDITMDAVIGRNIRAKKNSGPYIGPLIVSQFQTGANGFIELKNVTNSRMKLCHKDNGCMKVTASQIDFTFPEGIEVEKNRKVLIVSNDAVKNEIKQRRNFRSSTQIFVQEGILQDFDEIKIRAPEKFTPNCLLPGKTVPDDWEGPIRECKMTKAEFKIIKNTVHFYKIDKVDFTNEQHWGNLLGGNPLERNKENRSYMYGNDPISWKEMSTAEGTPGK